MANASVRSSHSDVEKYENATHAEQSTHQTTEQDQGASRDSDKTGNEYGYDVSEADDSVPLKTWVVVTTLSFSYGASFWPVPFFSTIQSEIAASLGASAASGTWFTSCYIAAVTITFMVCGANSDLFGRRWFILSGNIFVFIGAIIGATSHSIQQSIAASCIIGIGAGECQMAAFAIPELLPNRWRHIGVVIADGVAFFVVIAGPVTARVAILHGDAWRWGYWTVVITIAITFAILTVLYYPPKHPRGIPWDQALRHLDYVGIVSFTLAAALILSGIVYVQLLPASDPTVISLLVTGFGCLIFFSLWETFAPLKEPLTPTRLFTKNKGRALSFPFVMGAVVTMFYYGTNIIWGTMVSVLFSAGASTTHIYWLATVQGFGILLGGSILFVFGNTFGHWKWQMGLSIFVMTFFGGLLAYITPERESLGIAFAFLSAAGFGYAQYLSITYIQFGTDQTELGIAGGLAGVAREGGGAIAVTVFATILSNVQSRYADRHIVSAAEAAGASPRLARSVAAALPLGNVDEVKGVTKAILTAAGGAFVESYVQALKTVSLTLLGFGIVGLIACCFLEDIGPKMTRKIEVYLENDVKAHKNKYH